MHSTEFEFRFRACRGQPVPIHTGRDQQQPALRMPAGRPGRVKWKWRSGWIATSSELPTRHCMAHAPRLRPACVYVHGLDQFNLPTVLVANLISISIVYMLPLSRKSFSINMGFQNVSYLLWLYSTIIYYLNTIVLKEASMFSERT